ncbi:hypothetical protein EV182_001384 [Spiromyces aspiralis]|uniref:Uncharacterized protein n=1 Tax=Spiromyces aspiralis TaxID=68401 RepID=A0ACC1HVJ0_9FUNG|nr:hypothetical protein EV182_001384 [Spiromyces aspiralis]
MQSLPLRSLCWRIYLGILPDDVFGYAQDIERVWPTHIQKERAAYQHLQAQWVVNPRRVGTVSGRGCGPGMSEQDLGVLNPLSQDENHITKETTGLPHWMTDTLFMEYGDAGGLQSPWKQYFKDQELREMIKKDVKRTFPDDSYYQSERVQEIMTNVLFIYSKVHSSVSYRQGMHELVAPLLAAIDADSVDVSRIDPYLLSSQTPTTRVVLEILDRQYIEHDTYALFDHLMQTCAPWYHVSQESQASRPRPASHRHDPTARSKDDIEKLDMIRQQEAKQSIPIVMKCHKLFHDRLSQIDPELVTRIKDLKIEPQIFGIRWFRLLFSREIVDRRNMFALWDCIFADNTSGPLGLCEWVALVMLLAVQHDVVSGNYVESLQSLLHFPRLRAPSQKALAQTPSLASCVSNLSSVGVCAALDTPVKLPQLSNPALLPAQRIAIQAVFLRNWALPTVGALIAKQWDYWLGRISPAGEDEGRDNVSDSEEKSTLNEDAEPARRRAHTLPEMDDDTGGRGDDEESVYSDTLSNHYSQSLHAVPIPIPSAIKSIRASPLGSCTQPKAAKTRKSQRKHYTGSSIRNQNSPAMASICQSPRHSIQSIPASPISSSPCGSESVYSIMPSIQPGAGGHFPALGQGDSSQVVTMARSSNERLLSLGVLTDDALSFSAEFLRSLDTSQRDGKSVNIVASELSTLTSLLSNMAGMWRVAVQGGDAGPGAQHSNSEVAPTTSAQPRDGGGIANKAFSSMHEAVLECMSNLRLQIPAKALESATDGGDGRAWTTMATPPASKSSKAANSTAMNSTLTDTPKNIQKPTKATAQTTSSPPVNNDGGKTQSSNLRSHQRDSVAASAKDSSNMATKPDSLLLAKASSLSPSMPDEPLKPNGNIAHIPHGYPAHTFVPGKDDELDSKQTQQHQACFEDSSNRNKTNCNSDNSPSTLVADFPKPIKPVAPSSPPPFDDFASSVWR